MREPQSTSHDSLTDPARQPLLSGRVSPEASSSDGESRNYEGARSRRHSGESDAMEEILISKLGATMLDFFISGVAMAGVGVLIPDIEKDYRIDDGIVALVFPAVMVGYLCSSITLPGIHNRLGRRGIAWLAPAVRIIAAIVLFARPPFVLVLISFVFYGFGTGLADSSWNTWASQTTRPNICQGFLHGAFSLGCVIGPMLAVPIVQRHTWHLFYLLVVALSVLEVIAQGWAFRSDRSTEIHRQPSSCNDTQTYHPLRNRGAWLCGIFYFVYQGVEASFTDWIVVFMQRIRQADPTTSGLSTSTFWIGMTLGRWLLGLVTERFGVRISVAAYIALSLCVQLCLQLFSDIPVTLALLGASGFLLGPVYPSAIVLLVKRVPAQSRIGVVATAVAMGQVGGAIAPLGVGILATKLGIGLLMAVILGFSVLMSFAWAAFCWLI